MAEVRRSTFITGSRLTSLKTREGSSPNMNREVVMG
jgi:hypothetical protein